jgi:glutathione S-transferase
MPDFTIVIGNKNYSSWSLRGWMALKHTGAEFEEIMVRLDQPDTLEALKSYSPAAKVPVLKSPDGDIWDSLAICEYLAETFPECRLWPEGIKARAHARVVSAEMHSGFVALRSMMPMDLRGTYSMPDLSDDLRADIERIDTIWQDCRNRFGQSGPFLFGEFSIADCMFAPVVARFVSYGPEISTVSRDYIDTVMNCPEMKDWIEASKEETWVIKY